MFEGDEDVDERRKSGVDEGDEERRQEVDEEEIQVVGALTSTTTFRIRSVGGSLNTKLEG